MNCTVSRADLIARRRDLPAATTPWRPSSLERPVFSSNAVGPSPARALAADVLDVAGKFRCACGSCEEPELAECTCPTAVEEKELISWELRRGQGEAEVVRLVERRYGGLKSRFASMLGGGPPATESAAEGFAQSQLADYAEGDARRASGLRVLAAAVDSTAVVSRFTCACGEFQDHALSACDCDHPRGAVEMKAFIDHKISQQRHTVDELVRAVAYEYGHLVESAEAMIDEQPV